MRHPIPTTAYFLCTIMKFSNLKKCDANADLWKRLQEANRLSKASSERFKPEDNTATLSLEERLERIAFLKHNKQNQEE